VDSGAEKSIISRSLVPEAILRPCNTQLKSVSGDEIKTFGQCFLRLGVKQLRREYPTSFIVADVKPILGADFLTQHGLTLDMKSKSLHDPLTSLTAKLVASEGTMHGIKASDETETHSILKNFPRLAQAPDYTNIPIVDVYHKIVTKGSPVFCKPRPLSPAKLEVAKKEFDGLIKLGIVQRSSSPWASPLHMVKKI